MIFHFKLITKYDRFNKKSYLENQDESFCEKKVCNFYYILNLGFFGLTTRFCFRQQAKKEQAAPVQKVRCEIIESAGREKKSFFLYQFHFPMQLATHFLDKACQIKM